MHIAPSDLAWVCCHCRHTNSQDVLHCEGCDNYRWRTLGLEPQTSENLWDRLYGLTRKSLYPLPSLPARQRARKTAAFAGSHLK